MSYVSNRGALSLATAFHAQHSTNKLAEVELRVLKARLALMLLEIERGPGPGPFGQGDFRMLQLRASMLGQSIEAVERDAPLLGPITADAGEVR